jgi:hypothetical protein
VLTTAARRVRLHGSEASLSMAKEQMVRSAAVLLAIGVVTAATGSGCGGSTSGAGASADSADSAAAADAVPDKGCSCQGPPSAPCRCAPNDASVASCTLLGSAYDQSCQRDSDCVAVFLGDVCSDVCHGVCANAAINVRDDARYNADLNAVPQSPPSNMKTACSCAFGLAVCHAGSCAIGHIAQPPPASDAGDARGPGCASSTDCPTGDFCNLQIHGTTSGVCCPGFGCAPNCPNGVAKDANGCDTCQCAPSPDAGGAGTACTSSADCSNGQICGFPQADGCAAKGSCFPAPGVVCLAYSAGCACDGSEISVACTGLPSGYTAKPLLHTGVCASDAGGG